VDSHEGKRHVLKGLKERVRARFESRSPRSPTGSVAAGDSRARLRLSDARHANEVVSKAMDFIEDHVEGMVLDTTVEIL